jgi:hypothetical protein
VGPTIFPGRRSTGRPLDGESPFKQAPDRRASVADEKNPTRSTKLRLGPRIRRKTQVLLEITRHPWPSTTDGCVCRHGPQSPLGTAASDTRLLEDVLELYNVNEGLQPVPKTWPRPNPAKLEELKKKFIGRRAVQVQRAADRRPFDRTLRSVIAGRPDLMNGRTKLTLYEGAQGHSRELVHQHQEPFGCDPGRGGSTGQRRRRTGLSGGDFGGWSLYMVDGKVAYSYNWLGLEHYTITSTQKIPPGKHTIKLDFA